MKPEGYSSMKRNVLISIRHCLWLGCVFGFLANPFCFAAQDGGQLFPSEVEFWREEAVCKDQGIQEALQLRAVLLSSTAEGESFAEKLCRAVKHFQQVAKAKVPAAKNLDAFDMNAKLLRQQLLGEQVLPDSAFSAFDGRWYGKWDQSEVNHDWRPTVRMPADGGGAGQAAEPRLAATQYAWIGTGFGWNYLMQGPNNNGKNGQFVLGMVYYFDAPDFQVIRGKKPHVGFYDSPSRLIWITRQEVFFEEVFSSSQETPEHYVITGMYHNLLSDAAVVPADSHAPDESSSRSQMSPDAVQATYTRDPNHRPDFLKFQIELPQR